MKLLLAKQEDWPWPLSAVRKGAWMMGVCCLKLFVFLFEGVLGWKVDEGAAVMRLHSSDISNLMTCSLLLPLLVDLLPLRILTV